MNKNLYVVLKWSSRIGKSVLNDIFTLEDLRSNFNIYKEDHNFFTKLYKEHLEDEELTEPDLNFYDYLTKKSMFNIDDYDCKDRNDLTKNLWASGDDLDRNYFYSKELTIDLINDINRKLSEVTSSVGVKPEFEAITLQEYFTNHIVNNEYIIDSFNNELGGFGMRIIDEQDNWQKGEYTTCGEVREDNEIMSYNINFTFDILEEDEEDFEYSKIRIKSAVVQIV